MGAAIQGGITRGCKRCFIIRRNTSLFRYWNSQRGIYKTNWEEHNDIEKKSGIFNNEDNQPAVSIRVLQGEREMAADNKILGNFELVVLQLLEELLK